MGSLSRSIIGICLTRSIPGRKPTMMSYVVCFIFTRVFHESTDFPTARAHPDHETQYGEFLNFVYRNLSDPSFSFPWDL
jgi:hypothetical protein